MRLWHKDFIPILPDKQLLGQWRECCLIAKNIKEKGTPNHILVNKVMDYPLSHFISYAGIVYDEMLNRGYNITPKSYFTIANLAKVDKDCLNTSPLNKEQIFPDWHNDHYFIQCYYNLQEKYECGGISEEEWKRIGELFEVKLFDNI